MEPSTLITQSPANALTQLVSNEYNLNRILGEPSQYSGEADITNR